MTVLRQRMRVQHLSTPPTTIGDLLTDVLALQAQDVPALALAARARGVRDLAGPVVRTWAMRGTLHLIRLDDLWVLGPLSTLIVQRGRRRRLDLGLTDDLCARALPALREVLTVPLTRPEVVERLGQVGVALDPKSQAPAHLMAYAAASGVLHRGLDDTYALLPELPEPGTVTELWRRYRRAYGPATQADFLAWSGLPKSAARDLPDIEDAPAPDADSARADSARADSARADSARADSARADSAAPVTRMLGHFDPYLLGYRDRTPALDPAFASRVQTGGGFLTPHVVVDGRVVATWRRTPTGVEVRPFAEDLAARPDLNAEIADLAGFLGTGTDLVWR